MKNSILRIAAVVAVFASLVVAATAQVKITVVDVGTGECIVMALPGSRFVVYDTGDFASDDTRGLGEASRGHRAMMDGLRRIIPSGVIDMLILSHNDQDHIGGVPFVLNNFQVKQIYWAQDERGTDFYGTVKTAIQAEAEEGCKVVSMIPSERPKEGTTIYESDGAILTFLTGCDIPPADWIAGLGDSEKKNAGSIVVRLTYKGKSVLVCGDAVGRKRDEKDKPDDPPTMSRATEAHLLGLRKDGVIDLQSDVIIAPHHGGDNASSRPFIHVVRPTWVVFASGHDSKNQYKHPRELAASRYLAEGIKPDHMLRTDFGDNDTDEEWQWGDTQSKDWPGDDDVVISISKAGSLSCAYASMANRNAVRTLVRTQRP